MTIHFATDHAGYELKNILVQFVRDELGYEVVDHGAHELEPGDDYPDYIHEAARAVSHDGEVTRGIILGHSGQGEAMVANRYAGVRAAVYYGQQPEIITLSREHNDANILSLGAGFISHEEAKAVTQRWLSTAFSGDERHVRRIQKIDNRA